MPTPSRRTTGLFFRRVATAIAIAWLPATAASAANWQLVRADEGRLIEVDRSSIRTQDGDKVVAWGRIVFEKPVSEANGGSYRIIEALNRYDCAARTFMTLRRIYRKDEKTILREEEGQTAADLPVRTGTLDEKIFRIACRPRGLAGVRQDFEKVVQGANEAAVEMRKANEAKVAEEAKKDAVRDRAAAKKDAAPPRLSVEVQSNPRLPAAPRRPAPPPPPADIPWGYDGPGAPGHWARINPDYRLCGSGQRQSPIDLRDTFRVDQPEIEFLYRPSHFRIVDTGHALEFAVADNSIRVLGKHYRLLRGHFHRPGEHHVDGRGFAMSVHLEHRAIDGEVAIVAVNLVAGREHPLVQTLWNNLPLERYEVVAPPAATVDLDALLPATRGYFHYLGSLSAPPCTEGVVWLVMKQPVEVSEAQIAVFARLHALNARPLQAANGRRIKESR